MSPLEIIPLGTGSPLPDPERAGPATLVRSEGANVLVDCGRGVLMRAAAAGTPAGALDAVILTHLHSDHIVGLPDILTTRWITSFQPAPLRISGPPGTAAVVEAALAFLEPDIGYRLAHHDDLTWRPEVEVTEVADGMLTPVGPLTVAAAPTSHHPASPSFGYRFEHEGRVAVVAGDSVPCPGLDRLCSGAGLLIHTVIRRDVLESVAIQRLKDVCDYHSSVEDAARTASRGGVRTLVLTHCVPAVGAGEEPEWRALAARHFDGLVVVPRDLDRIDVPGPASVDQDAAP